MKVPPQCGTWPAIRLHRIRGQSLDEACRALDRRRHPRVGPKPVPECGTEAAYSRHRRLGEPRDQACREAHSRNGSQNKRIRRARIAAGDPTLPEAVKAQAEQAQRRAERDVERARNRRHSEVQAEALEALTHRHREEFLALLEKIRKRSSTGMEYGKALIKLAEAYDEEYSALYDRVMAELEESDA